MLHTACATVREFRTKMLILLTDNFSRGRTPVPWAMPADAHGVSSVMAITTGAERSGPLTNSIWSITSARLG